MYVAIVVVKPLKCYKLLLTFEKREERIFDMKTYLNKGILDELKDEKIFKTVRVSFDIIEWSNELDISLEILYEDRMGINGNRNS